MLFVGAVLAFGLPFGTVSCDEETVHFTGLELATFRVAPDVTASAPELHAEVEAGASAPSAVVALVAALAGIALGLTRRRGGGICASVGLVAMQVMLVDGLTSWATVEFEVGFRLALMAFTAAGAWHVALAVERRRRGRRRLWPIALATVLTLSPTLLALGMLTAYA